MGSTEAQNPINWGLTEAGQERLVELRQQTTDAACTPMADWLDSRWPRQYTGADAAEIVEFAAELLRYPVNVGFPEKNGETELRATDEARPPGWRSHAHYSIAVDFDGVIHSYISPWEGAHIIPDPPVLGALDWLERMAQKFHVIIFSTRCLTPEGCVAVRQYLSSHWHVAYHPGFGRVIDCHQHLPPGLVDRFECTATKEAALIYLDDRAVRFDGTNFPTTDDIHQKLIPWNKRAVHDSKHRI